MENDIDTKRAEKVCRMFTEIAGRYDLGNLFLSFGLSYYWRKKAIEMTAPQKGQSVLDMCCGTGDFAIGFAKKCSGLKIAGCDFSDKMIESARLKTNKLAENSRLDVISLEWVLADCTATDFKDKSFDIVSCAFGVRNMADFKAGLAEMYRLLRPGGRACILEFGLPESKILRCFYLPYFRCILPFLGGVLTGNFGAYFYLARTVVKWSKKIYLRAELIAAGFSSVVSRKLSGGIVEIHLAHKT